MARLLGRAGLDLYADPPGTRVEEARAFFPALGGSAANIAVGLARSEAAPAILTTLSDDAVGRFALKELARYGVATEFVQRRRGRGAHRPSQSLQRATTTRSRSSIAMARPTFSFRPPTIDAFLSHGSAGSSSPATALAAEPSRTAAFLAADRARAGGAAVIFDIDYRPYSWPSRSEAGRIEPALRRNTATSSSATTRSSRSSRRRRRQGRRATHGGKGRRSRLQDGQRGDRSPFPADRLLPQAPFRLRR